MKSGDRQIKAEAAARGTTLVEMVVAVAVFAAIVAVALDMSLMASRAASDTASRSALENEAEQHSLELIEALSDCTKLWSYADTHFVVFSVPVDGDGNGTVLDAGDPATGVLPHIEFGARASELAAPLPNGEIVYFFGGQGATGYGSAELGTFRTLSEAVEGVDINGDGDMNDTFDVGTIYRQIYDSNGTAVTSPRPITGPNVVQRSGRANYGKCIKHDNCTVCDSSKIFFLDHTYIMHVNLWLLRMPESRRPILVHTHQQVYLRNQE